VNIFLVSEKYSPHLYFRQNLSRRGILGRNGDENLKTFSPCYSQSSPLTFLLTPMVLLDLFLQQQLKVGGGLAVFTIYLCLLLKVAMFSLIYTLFMYKYMLSDIETIIRKALKGVKPERKPYPLPPYGSRNPYKNNQSMKKTQVWYGILPHIC
jgi:hypothetical protein